MSADLACPGPVRRRALFGVVLAAPLLADTTAARAARPDAALIAMADELQRLVREAEALFAITPPDPDDAFLDAVDRNDQARWRLRGRILAIESTTPEGLRAKAFAFWSHFR